MRRWTTTARCARGSSRYLTSSGTTLPIDRDLTRSLLGFSRITAHGLDTVGARIWTLAQEPITVGAVRDAILQEYDVEPEQCERDLLDLLRKLAAAGLIAIKAEAA